MFNRALFLDVPLAAVPAGAGGNNTLSALTISAGTLAPAFASGTTAYTASVGNGVQSFTVTPTAANAGAVISISGRVETSGSPTGALDLVVGTTAIAIVVNGGGADNTYTITVTRGTGPTAPPNPVVLAYNVKGFGNFSQSITVSNSNASDMTINFPAWATDSTHDYQWITAFPLVIPANQSVQVKVRVIIRNSSTGFVGGTWSCGADNGTMEARITATLQAF